jgi:hypothetical protein
MPRQRTVYNCHSYAWHGGKGDPTDPGNWGLPPLWDNSPYDDLPGATPLAPTDPNRPGDIVMYGTDRNGNGRLDPSEIDHSAIVKSTDAAGNTTRVEGKEGQGPVTDHHPSNQNPSYGPDKEWYRP